MENQKRKHKKNSRNKKKRQHKKQFEKSEWLKKDIKKKRKYKNEEKRFKVSNYMDIKGSKNYTKVVLENIIEIKKEESDNG